MAEVSHQHTTNYLTTLYRFVGERLGLGLLVWAAGCANAAHYRGMEMSPEEGGSIVALSTVAQSGKNDCGYAAMASVALYHGVPAARLTEGEVPGKFQGPGLSAADLTKMAGMVGLQAYGYQGTVEDLEENVRKGRPVLVLLNHPPRLGRWPGLEWYADLAAMPFSIPHWVVVVGFMGNGDAVLHDPRSGLVSMTRGEFLDQWKDRSRIAVLVVAARSPAAHAGGVAAEK